MCEHYLKNIVLNCTYEVSKHQNTKLEYQTSKMSARDIASCNEYNLNRAYSVAASLRKAAKTRDDKIAILEREVRVLKEENRRLVQELEYINDSYDIGEYRDN